MQVFISWSGARSKALALHLHEWMKAVVQASTPWMSDRDIEAGQRWNEEISIKLKDTHFGVICLTPENLTAPWLLFEAGALAKAVDSARVVPVLFNVSKADLKFPLAQFQSVDANRDGLFALASAVNRALGDSQLSLTILNNIFNALWPGLESTLARVPEDKASRGGPAHRTDREVLEDVLDGVRFLQRTARSDRTTLQDFSGGPTANWEDHYVRGVNLANSRGGPESDLQALQAYAQAVALVPQDLPQNIRSRLYAYRGAMYKRMLRLEEAEHDLALASKWATETREIDDALYNMACIKAMTDRRTEALELIRSLVSRDRKWASILRGQTHYFASLMGDPEFQRLTNGT